MKPRTLLDLYSPAVSLEFAHRLQERKYSGWRFLYWFWHATSYRSKNETNETARSIAVFLGLGMLLQIALGVGFLVEWARYGTVGAWEFGLALLLSYPLMWAHIAVIFAWLCNLVISLANPKKAARSVVCTILEAQVRQLRARHKFKVVAVVGSLGKTSTKHVIASLVGQNLRVRTQAGNYNDRVTVPLVFFGQQEPSLYNVFAWLKVFGVTQSEIALDYPYDVVVIELGTDGPGQIGQFAYLKPDITVVTAVAPEHMEFFGDLDGVAKEELGVFAYSKQVLINGDDIAGEYLTGYEFTEYSIQASQAAYRASTKQKGLDGQLMTCTLPDGTIEAEVPLVGAQSAKFALAAVAVADMLGIKRVDIQKSLPHLTPFSGRMQVLEGRHGSRLIDDTYNAAPISMKAALDVLYAAKAPQRVAVLGSINEMGDYAHEAHKIVGEYCDPKKLDLVITVGKDAKKWLAPAAKTRGCTVKSFLSPYDAGDYALSNLKQGAVVLFKGSQNGVFTEESLKQVLANPEDASKLVRQSAWWVSRKAKQFPR